MKKAGITQIEILEDLTATGRCDEGFLHVRRLRCRNHRDDGTFSPLYRVDVVDRPRLDAVAVVVWRRGPEGLEVLTRFQLRPAAYFRKDRQPTVPDGRSHLLVEEIVAGLLETTDRGLEGIAQRAVAEVLEEAGYVVKETDVRHLGAPFFVAPGILSEKIYLTAVDVTGEAPHEPEGDGSPLEEGATCRWWKAKDLLRACLQGEIQDAKTEVAVRRLLEQHT